ncbi:hypothetical protein Tco_0227506 [Tanacetum coccineum]
MGGAICYWFYLDKGRGARVENGRTVTVSIFDSGSHIVAGEMFCMYVGRMKLWTVIYVACIRRGVGWALWTIGGGRLGLLVWMEMAAFVLQCIFGLSDLSTRSMAGTFTAMVSLRELKDGLGARGSSYTREQAEGVADGLIMGGGAALALRNQWFGVEEDRGEIRMGTWLILARHWGCWGIVSGGAQKGEDRRGIEVYSYRIGAGHELEDAGRTADLIKDLNRSWRTLTGIR